MEDVRNQIITPWDEPAQPTVNHTSPFLLGLNRAFTPYTGCGISPNSQLSIRRISNYTLHVWTLKSSPMMALLPHLHWHQHQLLLRQTPIREVHPLLLSL